MRKLQKPPVEELQKRKQEPLAEGLQITVPTDSAGRRLWRKMTDEQIVEYAAKWKKKKGITEREELRKTDNGLYHILCKRGLLDEIGFEKKQREKRSWANMSDEEIVNYARKVIEENRISLKGELRDVDSGLYVALRKRGLLDEVGFEEKEVGKRLWKKMSDEEVVGYAKKVMEEYAIARKGELQALDHALYEVLRQRGLLDEVGFVGKKQRKTRLWRKMSDDEIIEFARRFMKQNEISKRKDLYGADDGLYTVLRKRSLLDRAFAHLDQQKDDQARDAVIDALEAFAANDNNSAEDDVA